MSTPFITPFGSSPYSSPILLEMQALVEQNMRLELEMDDALRSRASRHGYLRQNSNWRQEPGSAHSDAVTMSYELQKSITSPT